MSADEGPVLVRGGAREGLYFRTRAGINRLLGDPNLSRSVSMPANRDEPMRYRGLALYIADTEDWRLLRIALELEYFRRKR